MRSKKHLALILALAVISGCSASADVPHETTASSQAESSATSEFIVETTTVTEESSSEKTEPPVQESLSAETVITESEIDGASEEAEDALTAAAPKYTAEQRAAFSEKLKEIYEKYDIVGMSAAVFSGGKVIYAQSLGYADKENQIPCSNNTKFRAASVSKIPSTIVLMQLCDKGLLSTESYLSDVTGIAFDDPSCKNKVQLWHLLTHTAGLVDTWAYNEGVTYRYKIDHVLKYSHSGMEPGTFFNYCNFGAGAMGAVAESLTGEYFHTLADKTLFKPLGMDAGYTIDFINDKKSVANVYDYDGTVYNVSGWGRTAAYYESFGIGNCYLTAQCELLISARDLAKLGIVLSGDGTVDGYRVLSEEAIRDMHKEYYKTENFGMGLNLRIFKGNMVEGRTIYGHPGNALGAVNGLFYDPSNGTGVAVLTNHCSIYLNQENGTYGMLSDVVSEAYNCFFS